MTQFTCKGVKQIKNRISLNMTFTFTLHISRHFSSVREFQMDSNFFWTYLVPLNVDVTGNITAKIVGVWSEFNIFCTLVTMATASILNFCNPKSCHTLRWIFLQNFMKFDERNPKIFQIPLFWFPWQLRQNLSKRFHFFWLISFH